MIIIVDKVDGNTEVSELKPYKSKPAVKGFELFESLGLVMGVSMLCYHDDMMYADW